MADFSTNWFLQDSSSKKKAIKKDKLPEEIQRRLKLIEKAFR
jgi:hypothetical protein